MPPKTPRKKKAAVPDDFEWPETTHKGNVGAPALSRMFCARCAKKLVGAPRGENITACGAVLEVGETKKCARCAGFHKPCEPVRGALGWRRRHADIATADPHRHARSIQLPPRDDRSRRR